MHEALREVSSSLKTVVARMEGGLRTVNQLTESWPMDSLEARVQPMFEPFFGKTKQFILT